MLCKVMHDLYLERVWPTRHTFALDSCAEQGERMSSSITNKGFFEILSKLICPRQQYF